VVVKKGMKVRLFAPSGYFELVCNNGVTVTAVCMYEVVN